MSETNDSAMARFNSLIKESMDDPKFQMECVKCKKKIFYQFISPHTGRCMACPSPIQEAVQKKMRETNDPTRTPKGRLMNYKSGAMIESERDELIARSKREENMNDEQRLAVIRATQSSALGYGGISSLTSHLSSDTDFLLAQLAAERERSRILREALEAIRWSWANDAGRECDNIAHEALAAEKVGTP